MTSTILRALILFTLSVGSAFSQLTATYISSSGEFLNNPHDLKLSPDGNLLFVSDVGNNRVAILDPESLNLIAEFGADHQSGTHDIDFDNEGLAYVADTHNNRITIYQLNGTNAELVGELSRRIRGPEGVLAHPNGNIYVAGAWSGNVVAYKNGTVIAELLSLSSPHDLELAANGNIWLAEAGKDRMVLLTPDLDIVKILDGPSYAFDGVRYLDLLADGTLITADKNSHSIKIIASDDTLQQVIGSGKPGKGPGLFTTPEGVEVAGDTLWLSDSGNNRIVKYRLQN